MQRIFLFFICVFCCGCQRNFVTVVQEKIHRNLLASSFVDSPDPMQYDLPHGKRLYISWNIDRQCSFKHCVLRLSMIFRNRQIKTVDLSIPKQRGTLVYSLLDQEYYDRRGLLAYKVELLGQQEEVMAVWTHQLWVNIIQLHRAKEEIQRQIESPLLQDDSFSSR